MSYFIFLGIFPVFQLSPVETVFITFLMSSLLRKCNNFENYTRKVVFWTQDPSCDPKLGIPKVRFKTERLAPQNIQVGPKIPYFISLEKVVAFLPHAHHYITTGLYVQDIKQRSFFNSRPKLGKASLSSYKHVNWPP